MTIFQSLFLGFIQGITEFLPVSSSGHLVIIPYLLGWEIDAESMFVFDVLVQVATMIGVIAYFWRDYVAIGKAMLKDLRWQANPQWEVRLGWLILIGTIPAGGAGLLLNDLIETAFNSPLAAASFLVGTACLLFIAEKYRHNTRSLDQTTWKDALIIGLFQTFALFPGLSRSGSTITGGMLRGLQRTAAARFAFLMALPIMLAAGLLSGKDLWFLPGAKSLLLLFLPGFITSAVIGYLAIGWLLRFLMKYSLRAFAVYCLALALITFVVYFIRL
mgnify:CR=1 FL=1